MSPVLGVILVIAGLWTFLAWPPMIVRTIRDPRSRNEHGQASRFLLVAFMLGSTSIILGLATVVIGVRLLQS